MESVEAVPYSDDVEDLCVRFVLSGTEDVIVRHNHTRGSGDEVWSIDTSTGESGPEPVLAQITGLGLKHPVQITGATGVLPVTATWTATANHPI